MKQNSIKARRVDIQLIGTAASGKTTIMHIIGKALTDAGFNVSASDEDFRLRSSDFDPRPIDEPDKRPIHISTAFPSSPADKTGNTIKALVSLEPYFKQLSRDITKKMVDLQGTDTNQIFVHFDREIAKVEKACDDAVRALVGLQQLQTPLDQLDNLSAGNISSGQDQNRQV